MATTTYSFSDVSLVLSHPSVGKCTITGEGVGSVTVSRANDLTQHDVAADGSVMVSKVNTKNGTIAIATGTNHKQGVVMDASLTNCYVEFNLPEDCREFRANFLGFSSCSKSGIYSASGKKFKIEFYLDDQLVQTLTDLTENDVLEIAVPTENAAKLTIRASNSGTYSYGYFALANVSFVTGTIPSICEQNPYARPLICD